MIIGQAIVATGHIAVKIKLTGRTDNELPSVVIHRGDGSQIASTLRQRVVGEVGIVARTHDDGLRVISRVGQSTVTIGGRIGEGVLFGEPHVLQTDQLGKMVSCVDVSNGSHFRLDGLVVGQDDDVAVSLEIAQLRQVVVHGIGDVLQVDADGVADANATDSVKVELDGGTRGAVLHKGGLVEVARNLVSSDDTIHRGVISKHGTRFHGKDFIDGVNRSYRQVLDRRFGILFLAGGKHHAHHGKKQKCIEYSVFHFIWCLICFYYGRCFDRLSNLSFYCLGP